MPVPPPCALRQPVERGAAMNDILLAVGGGNSKTDVVLLAADGTLIAAARRPTVSHQQMGLDEAGRRLRHQVIALAAGAGLSAGEHVASLGVLCLAGMDLPTDARALTRIHAAVRNRRSASASRTTPLPACVPGSARRLGAVGIVGRRGDQCDRDRAGRPPRALCGAWFNQR